MYSGSGTRNDPYIVDNWTDFMTALQLSASTSKYIKWASTGTKVISEVNITSTEIRGNATEIDFNGWTIEQFNINVGFSATMGRTIFYVGGTSDGSSFLGTRIRNLTVNNFYLGDPSLRVFGAETSMICCYIDNITSWEFASNHQWWLDYGGEIRNNVLEVWYCKLNYNGKDTGRRSPNISVINYSEIYVNYKYTLNNASERGHGIIPFGLHINNSYYYGKFDVSEGSGSWAVAKPASPLYTQSSIYASSSIFNIQTVVSENCTLREVAISAALGDWTWDGTGNKSYFVINNGNNYEAYNNSVRDWVKGLLGDVKNPDQLYLDEFPYIYDDLYRNPKYTADNTGQDWRWRWSSLVNDQIPFLPFWDKSDDEPVVFNGAVDENPYICVFDMETPQNGFEGHGLAVLRPTSCRIVEELNGAHNLTLVHPIDSEGKWKYILEMNIIKALGQLYVIQKVDEVNSGGSGYVQAYAEHITYTLNDKWIFPPVEITGYQGQTLINSIMSQATDMGGSWQTQYTFSVTTDIDADETFKDWYYMPDGVTPYEMLIGDSGFIAKLGGELYRDNFTMKINERMYGAQDDAFELAIGYNLTGIKRTVDLQTFCTYLRGYDLSEDEEYNSWFAVSWDPSTLPRAYPRNVVRSMNFTYEHPEYAEGQLGRDTMAFFNQNCAPLVSYELNVQDLKRNPEYKGFENNYRYKVGDKGWVWDERLKTWLELEITRTEKDGITGDCVKVVIGTQRSFTRPSGYVPVIPRPYVVIPESVKTVEGQLPITIIANGEPLLAWSIECVSGTLGEHGENVLDQAPVTIANGATGTYEGTIKYSYMNSTSVDYYPPDIPDGAPRGNAQKMQWFTNTYSKSRVAQYGGVNISCKVDERPIEYASSQYKFTLPAGSYKFIFEAFDQSSSNRWRSDRLYRWRETNGYGQPEVRLFASDDTVLATYSLVQADYSNTKFIHEEMTFTLAADTDVGVFFLGIGAQVHPRFQIVDSSVVAQPFEVGQYSGVSCWKPYELYIPLIVSSGGASNTVKIPISEPLEAGEIISSEDISVSIGTINGSTTYDISSPTKPRMSLTYKEGGVIGGD